MAQHRIVGARALTLVQISFSHYNERARWALDYAGLPYKTIPVLPLLHFPTVAFWSWWYNDANKRAGRANTSLSTPLLLVNGADGTRSTIHESGDIVTAAHIAHPQSALIPASWSAQDDAFVQRLHDELGPAVRTYVYGAIALTDASIFRELGWRNSSMIDAAVWVLTSPLLCAAMYRAMYATPERARRAAAKVEAIFDDVSKMLAARAGPTAAAYLGGDGRAFTAADLTFASLGALVVGIDHDAGYGGWVPPRSRCSREARDFIERMRATPAGQHIVRCYSEHRVAPSNPMR